MEKTNLLQGRNVLVTGASRGIGAATAKLFAQHGAKIAVNYRGSKDAANRVCNEIQSNGGFAMPFYADVTDEESVTNMVEDVLKELGPIDTLVLNAAIRFNIKPFLRMSWNEFESKLMGELMGAFFPCKAVIPGMVDRKNGCIIAISTGLSRHAAEGFIAHSSAKAALDAFVRGLAAELGPMGIRVNAIAPGLTETDATSFLPEERKKSTAEQTPLRRIGQPYDVAGAALLLALPQACFITGTYLPVSGGMQMN